MWKQTCSLVLTLALCGPAVAQGALWVVDAAAEPGSDFVDLQPAIDAAAEGDTILVRDGVYRSFAISAKSLQIIAEEHDRPVVQELPDTLHTTVRIEDLAAGQSVLVRGIDIHPTDTLLDGQVPATLVVTDCLGSVWVEDVEVLGNRNDPTPSPFVVPDDRAGVGAHILSSTSVQLVRCSVTGSTVSGYGNVAEPNDHGLVVSDSTVNLYDCTLKGGGASGGSCTAFLAGTPNHGVYVEASVVFASGTSFLGGAGGCGCIQTSFSDGEDADGGDGLHVVEGASRVTWLGCDFVGGNGCDEDGLDIYDTSDAVEALAGASRWYSIETPVRSGMSANLEFHGEPGDVFALWYAQDVLGLYLPAFSGVWLPGLSGKLAIVGAANPITHQLKIALPVGLLAPGVDATEYLTQGIAVDPNVTVVLASGSALGIITDDLPAPPFGDGPHCLADEFESHEADDYNFGRAVAVGDGWVAVGLPRAETTGIVWIYELEGTSWVPVQKLAGDPSTFPGADIGLSLSSHGDTLIAGAPGENLAYAYRRLPNGAWVAEGSFAQWADLGPNDFFGRAVSVHGDAVAVAAENQSMGAVYIHRWNGVQWKFEQKLTPSDPLTEQFGSSVCIQGDRLIVGARSSDTPSAVNTGRAFLYERIGGLWTEIAVLNPADPEANARFGTGVALDADQALVGCTFRSVGGVRTGSVYLFEPGGSGWEQVDLIEPSAPLSGLQFGAELHLSGSRLAVFARGSAPLGRVFLYESVGGSWLPTAVVLDDTTHPGDYNLGNIGLLNDRLVVGSGYDGGTWDGKVRVYSVTGGGCP